MLPFVRGFGVPGAEFAFGDGRDGVEGAEVAVE